MSNKNGSPALAGLSLPGCVFLVLFVLKLAEIGNVATWSWLWITAPLWIPFALILLVSIIYVVKVAMKTRR